MTTTNTPGRQRRHSHGRSVALLALCVMATGWLPGTVAASEWVQTRPATRIRAIVVTGPVAGTPIERATAAMVGMPLSDAVRAALRQRLMAVLDTGTGDWTIDTTAPLTDDGRWTVSATPPVSAPPPLTASAHRPHRTRRSQWQPATRDDGFDAAESRDYRRWLASPSRALIVRRQRVLLLKTQDGVRSFGIAVGRRGHATPLGERTVHSVTPNPVWFPTAGIRRDAAAAGRPLPRRVPPGPRNPLGAWFIALGGSIGIHGTNVPSSIGRAVSRGCIRMHPDDISTVAHALTAGDAVTIVDALTPTLSS